LGNQLHLGKPSERTNIFSKEGRGLRCVTVFRGSST